MISALQLLCMAVVLLGTVFVMGGLHPLHPSDSFLLTGVPIVAIELALVLCFARGLLSGGQAGADQGGRLKQIHRTVLVPGLILVAAAMAPTVLILYADQALDRSRGVMQTLPVESTYWHVHKGSTTYYAVVPATAPPPLLSVFADTRDDIALPRATWQKIVPGKTLLTLTIHPGRFGLPWYDDVSLGR